VFFPFCQLTFGQNVDCYSHVFLLLIVMLTLTEKYF
jgi:hypothetical protein